MITSGLHCAVSRGLTGDGFTDPEPRTSYEPKRAVDKPIVIEQEIQHSIEESQIAEIEDKFSLPCNQSLLSSTQDSTESLASLKKQTWTTNKIRALLASPRYLPEREASAER